MRHPLMLPVFGAVVALLVLLLGEATNPLLTPPVESLSASYPLSWAIGGLASWWEAERFFALLGVALAGGAVFSIVFRMTGNRIASLGSSLLFVAHPGVAASLAGAGALAHAFSAGLALLALDRMQAVAEEQPEGVVPDSLRPWFPAFGLAAASALAGPAAIALPLVAALLGSLWPHWLTAWRQGGSRSPLAVLGAAALLSALFSFLVEGAALGYPAAGDAERFRSLALLPAGLLPDGLVLFGGVVAALGSFAIAWRSVKAHAPKWITVHIAVALGTWFLCALPGRLGLGSSALGAGFLGLAFFGLPVVGLVWRLLLSLLPGPGAPPAASPALGAVRSALAAVPQQAPALASSSSSQHQSAEWSRTVSERLNALPSATARAVTESLARSAPQAAEGSPRPATASPELIAQLDRIDQERARRAGRLADRLVQRSAADAELQDVHFEAYVAPCLGAGVRALDIAPTDPAITARIAQQSADTLALIAPEQREAFAGLEEARVLLGDPLATWPVERGSIDLVRIERLAAQVEVAPLLGLLMQAARVLRPGGQALVQVTDQEDPETLDRLTLAARDGEGASLSSGVTRGMLQELAGRAGLELRSVHLGVRSGLALARLERRAKA